MVRLNLLDIAKLNGNDPALKLIEANIRHSPEAELFPFRTIKGTSYKTGIRTGLPTVGFRNANEGQTPSKSTFEQKVIEAFIFGGQIAVDAAVADADEQGADHVKELEASGVTMASMRAIGTQVWYGVTSDEKGFPGLKAATAFGTVTTNGDAITSDAGGTTPQTGSCVYAVKLGEEDVTLIGGNNRGFTLRPWRQETITNVAGRQIDAFTSSLTAWIGLQFGHENCVRRICNLTTEEARRLNDRLLADMFETFPVGFVPDAIFMSRRSRKQLQASRTLVLTGPARSVPTNPRFRRCRRTTKTCPSSLPTRSALPTQSKSNYFPSPFHRRILGWVVARSGGVWGGLFVPKCFT